MTKGIAAFFIVTGLFLSTAGQVRGDANVYWDFDNGFYPSRVVIGPGESVTWLNIDLDGFDVTVTFDNGFSFPLPNDTSENVQFLSPAGTYSYQGNYGLNTGVVIVNLPPTVAITTPQNNAVLPAPATFQIQATATDTADDYVADVQFLLGTSEATNSIEDVTTAPFQTSITDLAAGTYVLLAVATDSRGAQATNAVTITVGAAPVVNLSAPEISAGEFHFAATGLTPGKNIVLLTSTNLISWQSVQTNLAANSAMTITNPVGTGTQFYRILQLP